MDKILFDKIGQFLVCCPQATLCAYVTVFHVYCHCSALQVKLSETVGCCSKAKIHLTFLTLHCWDAFTTWAETWRRVWGDEKNFADLNDTFSGKNFNFHAEKF